LKSIKSKLSKNVSKIKQKLLTFKITEVEGLEAKRKRDEFRRSKKQGEKPSHDKP
jgi:hypothetical protein